MTQSLGERLGHVTMKFEYHQNRGLSGFYTVANRLDYSDQKTSLKR